MSDDGTDEVARASHAAAVAALFREHQRALLAFLQCRLDSLADAQEVAQDAYLRMLSLEHPDAVDSMRAYLFRIASNLAMDRLRMRKVRREFFAEQEAGESPLAPSPDQHAMAVEQLHGVREALRDLPAKTSRAFVLYAIEGRDFAVIAQMLKLSERMVRYHVTRALVHCRARVDGQEVT